MDSLFKDREITLFALTSLPIIILITIQSFLKIANANWAVTAYVGATLIISYYATLKLSLINI